MGRSTDGDVHKRRSRDRAGREKPVEMADALMALFVFKV